MSLDAGIGLLQDALEDSGPFGIVHPEDLSGDGLRLQYSRWLDSGNAGLIRYIDERLETICEPFGSRPWAKSAVVFSFMPRPLEHSPLEGLPRPRPGSMKSFIAAYAAMEDYHRTGRMLAERLANCLERRFGKHEYMASVDAAPVPEKAMAIAAGLGTAAPNSMTRVFGLGCSAHLGVLFTSLDLARAIHEGCHALPCSQCLKCLRACPGHAISETSPISVAACRSWLAGELHGPLDLKRQLMLKCSLYGCSACSSSCPESPRREDIAVDPLELVKMPSARLRAIIRDTPIGHIGTTMLKRNALAAIAAQSTEERRRELGPALLEYCGSDVLRQTVGAWRQSDELGRPGKTND